MKSLLICLDFDGTVVEHKYPSIGPECPGAIFWLRKWLKTGAARIILWTMRSKCEGLDTLQEAVDYLTSLDIKLFGVNENPLQKTWTNSPKAYAQVYVDDAALGCPLIHPGDGRRAYVNWAVVGPEIYNRLIELNK